MTEPLTLVNPNTFFGAPVCQDLDELDAQVGIIGIPFDQGVNVPFEVPGESQGPDTFGSNSEPRKNMPPASPGGFLWGIARENYTRGWALWKRY